MECRQASFLLNLRRPGIEDLGTEVSADLDSHLAGCPDCAAFARTLSSEDTALARAVRAVVVPAGLQDRLHRRLKDSLRARSRRRYTRVAAIAASLLLAVGLGIGLNAASRPHLDTNTLVMIGDEDLQNPDQTTRRWLAERNLPTTLPLAFDYDLVVFKGTGQIQGRDVPVLVFRHPTDRPGLATVYFCRDDQFANLKSVKDAQSSYFSTTMLRDDHRFPGYSFVVVHTGQDLKPFLKVQGLDGVSFLAH